MHLLGAHAEVVGETGVGGVHPFPGLAGGGIGVVGLHLEPAVVLAKPVDHRAAGVGTAGVLEEGLVAQPGLLEGRELGTDEIEIEAGRHRR